MNVRSWLQETHRKRFNPTEKLHHKPIGFVGLWCCDSNQFKRNGQKLTMVD